MGINCGRQVRKSSHQSLDGTTRYTLFLLNISSLKPDLESEQNSAGADGVIVAR